MSVVVVDVDAQDVLELSAANLAAEYDVNRKTIRRRLDAAARADAERARGTATKRPYTDWLDPSVADRGGERT